MDQEDAFVMLGAFTSIQATLATRPHAYFKSRVRVPAETGPMQGVGPLRASWT